MITGNEWNEMDLLLFTSSALYIHIHGEVLSVRFTFKTALALFSYTVFEKFNTLLYYMYNLKNLCRALLELCKKFHFFSQKPKTEAPSVTRWAT